MTKKHTQENTFYVTPFDSQVLSLTQAHPTRVLTHARTLLRPWTPHWTNPLLIAIYVLV